LDVDNVWDDFDSNPNDILDDNMPLEQTMSNEDNNNNMHEIDPSWSCICDVDGVNAAAVRCLVH